MSTTTNSIPRTLRSVEAGETRSIYKLRPGADYIWHAGAFRRVYDVDTSRGPNVVRMPGGHVLRTQCATVEAARPEQIKAEGAGF